MFDAIVIGGGPAGSAAALTLGRALRPTLLLDSGEPRNAPATAMHNFLSRDGLPPVELRRIARQELAHYATVTVRDRLVVGAAPLPDGGFQVRLDDGGLEQGRRLVLATGLVDELPPIEGLASLWGRSVFHCPYCHGFEVRDTSLAVLGATPPAVHLALHLTRFSNDVVLCTDGPVDFDPHLQTLLDASGVAVRRERVARLDGDDGHLRQIVFADGESLPRHALFCGGLRTRQRSDVPVQLGCALLDDGSVAVSDFAQTSVTGVYAAGDMARRVSFPGTVAAVVVAAASGMMAGAFVDKDLLTADLGLPNPFAIAAGVTR